MKTGKIAYGQTLPPGKVSHLSGMTRNYQGYAERHREKKLKAEGGTHMTRNDIATILAGVELTDAQVKALLDVNSADITKALSRQKDGLTAANEALKKARETIAALEAGKADAAALQKQIDQYKRAEDGRAAAEKQAREEAELLRRMDAALDGRGFVHEKLRDIVAGEFRAALADEANRGKSDREVFAAVTRDKG